MDVNSNLRQRGFTLIELLLVVVIIGVMLAVVVPRAWRANVDAKYGLVRQNCAELASFASLWAEEMMAAQDLVNSDASPSPDLANYYNSLSSDSSATAASAGGATVWIGSGGNWRTVGVAVTGRMIGGGAAATVESAVIGFVPPERLPRNPFSGLSVFDEYPTVGSIPGALAAGMAADAGINFYALIFQGTDSTSISLAAVQVPDLISQLAGLLLPRDAFAAPSEGDGPPEEFSGSGDAQSGGLTFHAGMGKDLAGLRNGVFMARIASGN